LQRSLDARTYNLWQRIVQADDIAAANIEGLEHCPSCDFAIIFEVDIDVTPVLTCLNEDCKLVSCRRCKKPVMDSLQGVPWIYLLISVSQSHTGRPCQDIEDAKLKNEHLVEEAMS
jgi:TRIAD3 protein (E3 ubiquitin-protein ligase RNF216)